MPRTLSTPAVQVIEHYLHLPFPGRNVSCPYYNNRRAGMRGGLRVFLGKGSVKDILEETMLMSLREKIDFQAFDDDGLKKFLVDNRLGIDCSGFAYYVLDAEIRSRKKISLARALRHSSVNPFRTLLIRLRPVENTGVEVFAHDANSIAVKPEDIAPGDFVVIMGANLHHAKHHMLVVERVEDKDGLPSVISYAHAIQWRADGECRHGVRRGSIRMVRPHAPLVEQEWEEKGKIGMDNETWVSAKTAERLEIRRLRILSL